MPARLYTLAFALSAFAAGGCDAGGPFRSGPYVQDVTSSRAVIALASDVEDVLDVEVSGPGAAAQASDAAPVALHAVELSGLAPDTVYTYRARTRRGGLLAEASFRTAPLALSRTVTFVALGDSGAIDELDGVPLASLVELFDDRPRGGAQRRVVQAILSGTPEVEAVLHTGDVVYRRGERSRYREAFFAPFAPLIDHVPLYAVLGNHDAMSEGGAPWLEAFVTPANNDERSERYYSFDRGDAHFVALDTESTDFAQGSPQRRFLEEDLDRSAAPWKIVFFHHPPFSDGRHADDGRIVSSLVPVFESRHVDLVLSGHDHNYQRFAPREGVTYVVTGGGGAELYDLAPSSRRAAGAVEHHYVRGRVGARRLFLEALDVRNRVLDALTLEK